MADLMTREKYKDACRYRMRETFENLLEIWDPFYDEELITLNNIEETLDILQNTIDELEYFKEKISTTAKEKL
ncbi:MAG TPA: hypothetical protein GXZ20_08060 [Halanaerobiaceae bacterium]|nr:hypothetical protein [Bacillota bacterium]HHU93068.1 hypothetical protein [Halanaerobiaceae bacterium]HOA41187.1 hypothetical protein [Halanaerobiales bacterium]HPZ63422.1 hypothetical protein [Halanaerobiales bacterium]HQD04591.1 hypothetical protein [Halanaerobiales bacterium]